MIEAYWKKKKIFRVLFSAKLHKAILGNLKFVVNFLTLKTVLGKVSLSASYQMTNVCSFASLKPL